MNKEKTTHTVKCHVTCNTDNGVPEVRADNWPQRLFMQLIPQKFIHTIGRYYNCITGCTQGSTESNKKA